jgi:cell wall-associated NlpC family hydrolase
MAWAARYATQGGSHAAATAIAFAMAQLGKPYQWGAAGPGAYDCSGLVYAAARHRVSGPWRGRVDLPRARR